jgi:hypothetical protein
MNRRKVIKIILSLIFLVPIRGNPKVESNFKTKLLLCLRQINTKISLQVADKLEVEDSHKIELELRDAHFGKGDIRIISNVLSTLSNQQDYQITSFSLSYNEITDTDIKQLSVSMPSNLEQLGLVGCSISDTGAEYLLEWLKKSTQLKLLCIEDNNFNNEFKVKFKNISSRKNELSLFI